ncbi:dephospho-CoA kinase [Undibacterium sp. SXout7W]|uniref:dephospho-CoA kinase n=1 Tax=Undibacterium sp. SXout7W TaxID=3413049 RepID=UPI003BEF9C68
MSTAFSLGLTGGIGSGKTTVANIFAKLGATIIDTDEIAHQLTAPGGKAIPQILAEFGADSINADGAMNRVTMRERVFTDITQKQKLEQILHPLIRQETELAASKADGDYTIFVVPLLVESGNWKNRVSRVLVVDCDENTQIQRVISRNGLTETQVRAIMQAQASRQQRLAAADDVIVNEGDISSIQTKINQLHQNYRRLAGLISARNG